MNVLLTSIIKSESSNHNFNFFYGDHIYTLAFFFQHLHQSDPHLIFERI